MTPSTIPIGHPDLAPANDHGARGPDDPDVHRPVFVYDVDNTTYKYDHPTITGAQVMAAAGINPTEGLIQILPDGTRESVDADDTVHLVSGTQFKRRPRFKRG
jgi:hypothetical protein